MPLATLLVALPLAQSTMIFISRFWSSSPAASLQALFKTHPQILFQLSARCTRP